MSQVNVKATKRYASKKLRDRVRSLHAANRVENIKAGGRARKKQGRS